MADGCGIRIMRVQGVGKVNLISIVDVTSRLKAERYPSLETTNPVLPDYPLTDTPSIPDVWPTADTDPGSWHRLLRYHRPFAFSHTVAFVAARAWRTSALYEQAPSHLSRDHRAHP